MVTIGWTKMVKISVDELVSMMSNGNVMDLGSPPTHHAKKLQEERKFFVIAKQSYKRGSPCLVKCRPTRYRRHLPTSTLSSFTPRDDNT